jgi:hypothetical protein
VRVMRRYNPPHLRRHHPGAVHERRWPDQTALKQGPDLIGRCKEISEAARVYLDFEKDLRAALNCSIFLLTSSKTAIHGHRKTRPAPGH